MRILHITLWARGGAGKSCLRLHEGLSAQGVDSLLWVGDPDTFSGVLGVKRLPLPSDIWLGRFDKLPLSRRARRFLRSIWSNGWVPWPIAKKVRALKPDVLHLHWVGDGAVPLRAFHHFDCPVVWTLHDMGALTGGCHHAYDCTRHEMGCGFCPQIGSERLEDLSRRNASARREAYRAARLTFVAPSKWIADLAARSWQTQGMPVRQIYPDLTSPAFRPMDRHAARTHLGLPGDACVLLLVGQGGFGNPHKGWAFAVQAVAEWRLAYPSEKVWLLLVGEDGPRERDVDGIPARVLKFVDDEARMAEVFSAADMLLMPSAAETFGLVALEAITCGRPVVALPTGGIPEVVCEGRSGALAETSCPAAFAAAIQRVRARTSDEWMVSCLDFVGEKFPKGDFVRRHLELYRELVSS